MSQNNLEQKKPLLLRLRGCWVTKWTAHCASWHTSWASLAQCIICTDIIHMYVYYIHYTSWHTSWASSGRSPYTELFIYDAMCVYVCIHVYIHSIFWHTSWAPWYTMYIIHCMPYTSYLNSPCTYISLLGHPAIHAMHTCLSRCIVNLQCRFCMYIIWKCCAVVKAHSFSHVDNVV